MTPEEKQVNKLGPGGYKCRCCGPNPKNRPQWRRKIRARLKAIFARNLEKELRD